jgi:hypothetical protein
MEWLCNNGKMDNDFTSLLLNNLSSLHFISREDELSFPIQSVHFEKYQDIRGASKEKGVQVIV